MPRLLAIPTLLIGGALGHDIVVPRLVAGLDRARTVEGGALRSLVKDVKIVYGVDAGVCTILRPGRQIEATRRSASLRSISGLGGKHTHALPRAPGPLSRLAPSFFVGTRLWADHKRNDLLVDLLSVDRQELLEGEQAVHLHRLEVTVLLAALGSSKALVPRLKGPLLLVDGKDSTPLLVQLDVLLC